MPREPRESNQLAREGQQPGQHRVVGIETGLAQPLRDRLTAIPPLHDLGEVAAVFRTQAEHFAQVAQSAARPVHDHRRGDGRALATVLFIDVLDDLLAAVVFEIDIDVRRLTALLRKETLEQQNRAALGIDRGDAEAVADERVRGGPPTLTQNILFLRELDEVVYG